MSQPNPLELAKQGHPKAIESLINRQMQPKGITAKVALKNNCLHIMLEAAQPPDQKALVPVIRKGITNLGVASIEILKIYGKQAGEQVPAWSQEFELVGKSSPSANSENIETPPKELSLKERAKQGDVEAITKLLNVALLNKNITSKATLKDGCLSIMLESSQIPDQETATRILNRELTNLKVESIKNVKVYGQRKGEEFPNWTCDLLGAVSTSLSLPTDQSPSFSITSGLAIIKSPAINHHIGEFKEAMQDLMKDLKIDELIGKFITFYEKEPKNRKIAILAGSALLIILPLLGLTLLKPGYKISGGMLIVDDKYDWLETGRECSGRGGYSDIHYGTQVVVTDNQDKTIAVGELSSGKKLGSGCFFPIEVKNVPNSDFYTIKVGGGRRGSLTYSKKELEERNWEVGLSLGD